MTSTEALAKALHDGNAVFCKASHMLGDEVADCTAFAIGLISALRGLGYVLVEFRCIFPGCVSTERHWHGGFPGGWTNPDDPDGAPVPFTKKPAPGVRDYNGAALGAEAVLADLAPEQVTEERLAELRKPKLTCALCGQTYTAETDDPQDPHTPSNHV